MFPWHGDRTGDGRSINKMRLHPHGCIESLKRPLTLRVTASNFFCCMNSYSLRTATCIFALVTVLVCNGNILTRGTQGSKNCMRDSSIAFSSLLFSFFCIFVCCATVGCGERFRQRLNLNSNIGQFEEKRNLIHFVKKGIYTSSRVKMISSLKWIQYFLFHLNQSLPINSNTLHRIKKNEVLYNLLYPSHCIFRSRQPNCHRSCCQHYRGRSYCHYNCHLHCSRDCCDLAKVSLTSLDFQSH